MSNCDATSSADMKIGRYDADESLLLFLDYSNTALGYSSELDLNMDTHFA